MKRTISSILLALFLASVFPTTAFTVYAAEQQAREADLPADAIAIESVADLDCICNEYPANGYYYLTDDLDMTDDVLEYGDFYNNGAGWSPIGTASVPFTGTFDGRGFTIKGLRQTRTADYTGLFGYATDAVIKNLSIDSAVISGGSYTGVVLGYGSNCTLLDCTVTGSQVSAASYSGMIIGYGTGCAVSDCNAVSGSVTASDSYCGGIAGYFTASEGVLHCTNSSKVSATGYAGGIAGYANGTIEDCVNTGSITSSGKYTGGIAGSASTVLDCVNDGSVSAKATGVDYTGGVVGYATTVTDCANTGSVVGTLYGSTNMTGLSNSYIGGVAGRATTLTRCYNLGDVKGNGGTYYYQAHHSTPTGGYLTTETATRYVYTSGVNGTGNASLSRCYNAGSITGNNYSQKYALTYNGTISDCYNFGPAVPLSYSAAATSCYNANGIISSNGTAENCYYYAASASGAGTLLTLRQLRIQSFFENWDFDTVWTMGGNEDYLYPELQELTPDYEKTLVEISIAALPDQVNYYDGDTLDLTGALLRLTYDNDTTEKISITTDMVSNFDSSTAGEQPITVSYKDFATTFPVTVTMRSVTSMAISSLPDKLTYVLNAAAFDPSGGFLTVQYDNGSTEVIAMDISMFTGFDSSILGVQTLTVSYRNGSATLDIRIANPYEIVMTDETSYEILVTGEPVSAVIVIASYNELRQLSFCTVSTVDFASGSVTGTLPGQDCTIFLLDTDYRPLCECLHSGK